MNNTFKIPEDKLKVLESLLQDTPILTNDGSDNELQEIYRLIPKLNPYKDDSHLLPHIGKANSVLRYYSTLNETLNNYFKLLFNRQDIQIFIISEVTYTQGGLALPHQDPDSGLTFNIMLEDNFKGGDLWVEGVLQDFYKRGDMVCFNGCKDFHNLTEVTAGKRKILSIWCKIKEQL